MKIALLTPYFPDVKTVNSGIANHFSILADELDNLGHEVIIIHVRPTYDDDESGTEKSIFEGKIIITVKISLSRWLKSLIRNRWTIIDFLLKIKSIFLASKLIKSVYKEYEIDVIETTSYLSLSVLSKLLNRKIPIVTRISTTFLQILHDHNTFKSRLLALFGSLEIMDIKRSKNLITHSKPHALELTKLYNIDSSKIEIIPHGVPLPNLHHKKYSGSLIKILYVGRLEFRKGSDILMKAIPKVLEQCSNIAFEIIGSDPNGTYEHEFKNQNFAFAKGVIEFRGIMDKNYVQDAYANCDIFVAPSRYESFGLIYIEGMSYAKPVIGCNIGGASEIIEDGYNGLLANVNDADSLAEKIISLVKNENLRQTIGTNARKTVEDKFSGKRLAQSSVEYYKNFLDSLKI